MRNRIVMKIGIALVFSGFAGLWAADLPASGFMPGWIKKGPGRIFGGADLYNHINGGAELFLEFGFMELKVQRYGSEGNELALEIYQMDCAESALGVYLMKCGKENPMEGIPVRHSGNILQLLMVKSCYYIQINNFDGEPENLPAVKILAAKTLETIPDEEPVTILDQLPPENRVEGSAWIFRGPFGLQPFYTLGEGDILQQKGKVFGLIGDYRKGEEFFTRILVPYPNRISGASAFEYLKANLDSYLKLLETGENRLVFEDFDSLFGVVNLKGNTLEIRVKLKGRPEN